MIQSLLIANRGEIACRIIRTARRLGVRTVSVFSDADADALHVRSADEAVHIGPSPVRESYLVGDKIIAAALATGAQAIHPGYGFLSENAEFAQAVIDAGLIWVGPSPASITAMGLKDAAKTLMQAAGVPTTPGYLGDDQSIERLSDEADAIGYPLLIKAVAGGGGKGMRKVDAAADFADALASCQREAMSSFGNAHVLLEKWITNPRHIEVQIFGDTHGNVVHLFERECSLQRRHQKVIEEAPSPGVTAFTREAICQAAVRAAKAVDYVGAGTIEFIADGSTGYIRADGIWFMEMNTRLQVEHPVTEEIAGVDLVEWQLRVASGEPLPRRQDELSIDGHAIEARLYAEDPATGFLPSVGPLTYMQLPEARARIETGVEEGDTVSPFYDPMIAKIVIHSHDRADALTEAVNALDATRVWPVKTNAAFLARLLDHDDVRAGAVTTSFIADHLDALIPPVEPTAEMERIASAALLLAAVDGERPYTMQGHVTRALACDGASLALAGFRLNGERRLGIRVEGPQGAIETFFEPQELEKGMTSPSCWVEFAGETVLAGEGAELFAFTAARASGGTGPAASDGTIFSPMPGRIIAIAVAAGDSVTKGQKLLTLEAMKMEHSLVAPFDGIVADLNAAEGGQVSEGALLVTIEKAEEA